MWVCFFDPLFVFQNCTATITRILMLYQANAATLTLFSKEDNIWMWRL